MSAPNRSAIAFALLIGKERSKSRTEAVVPCEEPSPAHPEIDGQRPRQHEQHGNTPSAGKELAAAAFRRLVVEGRIVLAAPRSEPRQRLAQAIGRRVSHPGDLRHLTSPLKFALKVPDW